MRIKLQKFTPTFCLSIVAMVVAWPAFANPLLMLIQGQQLVLGQSVGNPATSCQAILTAGASRGSGVYWLTDGTTPYQTYCDMTTAGGGWTLVATMADDSNAYWTANNWPNLYTYGAVYGSGSQALTNDFQSLAWHHLAGENVMFKANNSATKYLIYASIINAQTLRSKFPSTNTVVGEFAVTTTVGTWYYECSSLNMSLAQPDTDANAWAQGSKGFIWRSINNNTCNYDDTLGGVSNAYTPAIESFPTGDFYYKNIGAGGALNVFVRE
jgi:hypothetical protein